MQKLHVRTGKPKRRRLATLSQFMRNAVFSGPGRTRIGQGNMRFQVAQRNSTVALDTYFRYIGSIRSQLTPSAYAFASDLEHYRLGSRHSLHDALVRKIEIGDAATSLRGVRGPLMIRLSLLGPYHDCVMQLVYKRVREYAISGRDNSASMVGIHGDIRRHEVHACDHALIEHEIQFNSGTSLRIVCGDLKFDVTDLKR
jgi:hypothetical protein